MEHNSAAVSYTHGDGRKQSLGHVGDDDADEKDDGVEPLVAEDERDHEERDSEEERENRCPLSRDSPSNLPAMFNDTRPPRRRPGPRSSSGDRYGDRG